MEEPPASPPAGPLAVSPAAGPADPAAEAPLELPMRAAAAALGVSLDTVRRRIARGELAARQELLAAGGYRWLVQLPPGTVAPRPVEALEALAPTADDVGEGSEAARALRRLEQSLELLNATLAAERQQALQTLAVLQEALAAQDRQHSAALVALRAELGAELEARRREVSELHVLLQRAQEQLGPPRVQAAQLAAPAEASASATPGPVSSAPPAPAVPWRRWLRRLLS